jgi:competence protein ComFC
VAQQPYPMKRWGGWLAEAGDAVVSIFFPSDCRLCKRLLTRATRIPICEECLKSFVALEGGICEICGGKPEASLRTAKPDTEDAGQQESGICPICQARTYTFDRARSFAEYEGALVRAIVILKFEQIEPLAGWFATRLAEIALREREAFQADIVVPVPLHSQRQRERGYNQANLIAKPLARKLGLPCLSVLLMRTRARPDKQILTFRERWNSVRGAFATRPGSRVDNLRVLLVDDVMTTGATLDACARALRKAGAKSVVALTVARAARQPVLDQAE